MFGGAGRISWMALAMAAIVLQGLFVLLAILPPEGPIDFFQEWSSGREWLEGRSAYPNLERAAPRLLGMPLRVRPETVRVNAHPPASLLLGLPFALVSYPLSAEIWRFISLGLILVSVVVMGRWSGPAAPGHAPLPVAAILLVTSGPLCLTIFQGQLNAVLLACLVGAWQAYQKQRMKWAGIFLGIAGAIKLTPLLLLGYFALRSRWRVMFWGFLAFVAINALTLLIFGSGVFRDFAQALGSVSEHRAGRTNAALPGLWCKLFDPAEGRTIEPLLRSAVWDRCLSLTSVWIVGLLTALAIRRAHTRSEEDRAFALAITAMLLIGPLTWEHSLLLLMLPLKILVDDWERRGLTRRLLYFVAIFAFWLSPFALWFWFTPSSLFWDLVAQRSLTPVVTLTVLSYQCYALVLLFLLGMRIGDSKETTVHQQI